MTLTDFTDMSLAVAVVAGVLWLSAYFSGDSWWPPNDGGWLS